MAGEFDLIARYFAPLAGEAGLGLLDDAACLPSRVGKDQIISKDLLVEGVHFLPDSDPVDLAFKAVSVNVSDIAAKGAKPAEYFLGLSLPNRVEPQWFSGFAEGLRQAQQHYGISLLGGDTTATPGPLVISITALGYVDAGRMVRRSGAQPGDQIYVTGTLGDAALGLKALRGEIDVDEALTGRYLRPAVPHVFGQGLVGLASAAADVSDGLIADVGHICRASKVSVGIQQAALPLSGAVQRAVKKDPQLMPLVYSGGDDYQILFSLAVEYSGRLEALAATTGISITKIGTVSEGADVELFDSLGEIVQVTKTGYQHF